MELTTEEAVNETGLRFSGDDGPGIRRLRRGRGFSYRMPNGDSVADRRRREIQALAIPPAWSDVWICPSPRGHLQATGRDARGRKQYRYHDEWRAVREADKFDHLREFGATLPDLRRRIEADLALPGLTDQRVTALVVRLLDETLVRIGNARYVSTNGTYGLTTLRARHVRIDTARFELRFKGKSGVVHQVEVADRRLAGMVRRCHELGGQQLFTFESQDGEVMPVTSDMVNTYLREVSGIETSAKTFRTWGGTCVFIEHLANRSATGAPLDGDDAVVAAIDAAASALRNTRAVCRSSYVHPAVVSSFADGSLDRVWAATRASGALARAERVAQRLLG